MGIDPGLERLGYAVIEMEKNLYRVHGYGLVSTRQEDSVPLRLKTIYDDVRQLVEKYSPERILMEQLVFARNVTTAMVVSEVRGVVMLLAAQLSLPLEEIAPSQLKRAICGNGRATKSQIQRSVQRFLGLAEVPKPDDVADALALAMIGAMRR
ncbi:crossover junction endodeoxyribonuclease RuvC [Thermospira aquatica]|nr:crossover junction endodeoxyribonuclease RuvC [Thermospira aquatica]